MTVTRITERNAPVPFAGAQDAVAGVLKGVVICGLSSANRRVYPPDVLKKAAAKYEGKPVFLDHSGDRSGRGVREWFGEIRNVRTRTDGRLEGDLHYEQASSFAKEFESRAKNFPRSLGMSHVVQATTRRGDDGREVVEDIESVESVDLVASPATNPGGLLESTEGRTVTLRDIVEQYRASLAPERQGPVRKLLLLSEDDAAMGDMMAAPVEEPPADAEPEDALWAGFKSAIMAIMDGDGTAAEKAKKIGQYLKSHEKLTKPAEKSEPDEPAEESRAAASGALVEALNLLVPGLGEDAMILAGYPAAQRPAIAARMKQLRESAEAPQSHGRDKSQKFLPKPRPTAKVTWGD